MTVPDELEAYAASIGPDPDSVLEEMDTHAEAIGFPTVGPAVGGWLYMLTKLVDAERIFEFGSGFGYSAYWFARALPEHGEIVLTEVDADELEEAETYLDRGGFADLATFELGDAIETIERYDDPFDVALIDNEKERYVEAFRSVREQIPSGGIVVADNITAGPFDFETVRAAVAGEPVENASARGIADYLAHVEEDPAFETSLLPLGEGVAISRRR